MHQLRLDLTFSDRKCQTAWNRGCRSEHRVIAAAVADVERVALPRRARRLLREGVPRFQIERDLPLVPVEHAPQQRPMNLE